MIATHEQQAEYYNVITAIVRGCAFRSFLELGIGPGLLGGLLRTTCPNLERIHGVDIQNGADPPPGVTWHREISTDEWFRENVVKWDCVFVDAMHEHVQAMRDVINAMRVLTPDGLILLHDTYPPNQASVSPMVCGDVFRTYLALSERSDLEVVNLPLFNGLCIVRPISGGRLLTMDQESRISWKPV